MAIAQMNWGLMRHPLTDARMAEFADALAGVYADAEAHPGFVWRLPDAAAADELQALGHDALVSATVSVWTDVAALRAYTFGGRHGAFLERASGWFQKVAGPQLVIWNVDSDARPGFAEAFERLETLRREGPGATAFGWSGPGGVARG